MRKIYYIFIVAFFVLMLFPSLESAAACFPPQFTCCPTPGTCGPTCPDCTPVPLDGGLSALLIAGVAFGAKKLRSNLKA